MKFRQIFAPLALQIVGTVEWTQYSTKKLKYFRFKRSLNLEEFREKTFLKQRESLSFLGAFSA